jgi:hypothetical protein
MAVRVRSSTYRGEMFPEWVTSIVAMPKLDANATLTEVG